VGKPVLRQDLVDIVGQVLIDEVVARDVHTHVKPPTHLVEAACFSHRHVENRTGELRHEPVALGERNETVGIEQSERRVLPTYESLHAVHRAVMHVQGWLVVQHKGPLVDGISQGVEERKTVTAIGIVYCSVDSHARLIALRLVHGDVGTPEKLARTGPGRVRRCHADAGTHTNSRPVQHARIQQDGDQFVRDEDDVLLVVHLTCKGILVASEAGENPRSESLF